MVGQFYATANGEHRPIFSSAFGRKQPSLLACSDEEGHVSLLGAAEGNIISSVRHNDSIFDVQFSLDDSRLLLASADEFTYIRRTDDLEGNPLMCLGYHQGTVRTARWHPTDPNMLVTAARDGDMAVWDLRTASVTPSHSSPVAVYSGIHKRPAEAQNGRRSNPDRKTVVQAEFVPGQEHLIATIGQPDQYKPTVDIPSSNICLVRSSSGTRGTSGGPVLPHWQPSRFASLFPRDPGNGPSPASCCAQTEPLCMQRMPTTPSTNILFQTSHPPLCALLRPLDTKRDPSLSNSH